VGAVVELAGVVVVCVGAVGVLAGVLAGVVFDGVLVAGKGASSGAGAADGKGACANVACCSKTKLAICVKAMA
jgi:hypothetical protein